MWALSTDVDDDGARDEVPVVVEPDRPGVGSIDRAIAPVHVPGVERERRRTVVASATGAEHSDHSDSDARANPHVSSPRWQTRRP
jgi:hypothetical protein